MKSPTSKHRGFTLIEILIVMAILAMLAALVGPALFSNLGKGQRATAATQMDLIGQGLDTYRLDVGRYPRELNGLIENDTGRDVWNGPYLRGADAIPKDPWGNDYVYTPGDDDFDLLTYGADGAPGGEGDDADIEQ
jgi:general secretion pathway protein G